mmetsp:Transcript_7687/g.11605  ORF Transcript_7687/g.11605 Transcript_7687/m.11605 type:complete len:235 (+) Transcript_7687:48-752(+)
MGGLVGLVIFGGVVIITVYTAAYFVFLCLGQSEHVECSSKSEINKIVRKGNDCTKKLDETLFIEIFTFCEAREIVAASSVTSFWKRSALNNILWRFLMHRDYNYTCKNINMKNKQEEYSMCALKWMKNKIKENPAFRIGIGHTVYDFSLLHDICPCSHVVLDRYAGQIVPAIDFECVRHSSKAIELMKSATVAKSPQTGALDSVRRRFYSSNTSQNNHQRSANYFSLLPQFFST